MKKYCCKWLCGLVFCVGGVISGISQGVMVDDTAWVAVSFAVLWKIFVELPIVRVDKLL